MSDRHHSLQHAAYLLAVHPEIVERGIEMGFLDAENRRGRYFIADAALTAYRQRRRPRTRRQWSQLGRRVIRGQQPSEYESLSHGVRGLFRIDQTEPQMAAPALPNSSDSDQSVRSEARQERSTERLHDSYDRTAQAG
jgi:hypothetical protein